MKALISRFLAEGQPLAVHCVSETGLPAGSHKVTLLDFPRLSLCLSKSARYQVVKEGVLTTVTVSRGEAIVVQPNCVMEPHPDGHYLALGIVFMPQMTRYLYARKKPESQAGRHQFLLSYHSQNVLDEDVRQFFAAISRVSDKPVDALYARRLVELILLKACEMVVGEKTDTPLRKAYFTWQAACQYIQENLQHSIGREEVANFLQLHPNHISRLFTQFSSETFNHYVLKARLEKARRLLKKPGLNIGDIARECGFSEANYFIRCFRAAYGESPGRVRGKS